MQTVGSLYSVTVYCSVCEGTGKYDIILGLCEDYLKFKFKVVIFYEAWKNSIWFRNDVYGFINDGIFILGLAVLLHCSIYPYDISIWIH